MQHVCFLLTAMEVKFTMPERSELRITKRTVDALRVDSADAVFWDRTLPGFGVRVYASGRKVYVVQARGPAGSRRVALGEPCRTLRRPGAQEGCDGH